MRRRRETQEAYERHSQPSDGLKAPDTIMEPKIGMTYEEWRRAAGAKSAAMRDSQRRADQLQASAGMSGFFAGAVGAGREDDMGFIGRRVYNGERRCRMQSSTS